MLLLSYLALYVSPEKMWVLAFFGLSYPVLLLINMIFMLFWMMTGKKYFLLSLITILLGINIIRTHIQIDFNPKKVTGENWIKVMSYNTRLFDYYNWTHSEESKNQIIDYIHNESPDIVCLQEFYSDDSDRNPILKSLGNNKKAKYLHVDYFLTKDKSKHYGLATLSSYPIVKKGKIQPDSRSNNYTIITDIKINTDTIRIFNVHLPSIRFDSEDFLFVAGITSNDQNKQDITQGSLSLIKKLKRAFQKRAKHVEIIADNIADSPYPVVVCGDFNDTPSSYAYKRMSKNLIDSFIESGSGFGQTYAGNMPSFRIDYIFHDVRFTGREFTTSDVTFSDHYPILTYLSIKRSE